MFITGRKVTVDGSFQARYGSNVRKKWRLIVEKMRGDIKCPRCETKGFVNRLSVGIWHCKKCDARFTGGAYYIETPRGAESFRVAKRKQRELEVVEE